MTSQPANLASLYPELRDEGTLRNALQRAVCQAGYELEILPAQAPGWRRTGANAQGTARATSVLLGISNRSFNMEFWERGVMMASGTTASLETAAMATGSWQGSATLNNLRAACPFVHYGRLAEAHEREEAVEAMWTIYQETTARNVDHELIEAAYAQPQLRILFPFHSHRTLNFSRCTGFPYTHDIPVVTPVHGHYRVTWWKTRSTDEPADVGEADNPHDAVALVLAHLPSGYGPAVPGTAHNLDNSDST